MNQRTSATSIDRTTRSTPSPPMPARRSQSARTNAGVSSSGPSPGGSSTKSLHVPCPLTTCTESRVRLRLREWVQRALAALHRQLAGARALPSRAVREHQPGLFGTLRPAEEVAKRPVASELAEPSTFRPRLDAFGDDAHTMRMRQLDDRRHDA